MTGWRWAWLRFRLWLVGLLAGSDTIVINAQIDGAGLTIEPGCKSALVYRCRFVVE